VIEKSNPDIVLLDVNMPGKGGIETVEVLRDRKNKVKVMMLTISQHDEGFDWRHCFGRRRLFVKNTEPEDLRKAIVRMVDGNLCCHRK